MARSLHATSTTHGVNCCIPAAIWRRSTLCDIAGNTSIVSSGLDETQQELIPVGFRHKTGVVSNKLSQPAAPTSYK